MKAFIPLIAGAMLMACSPASADQDHDPRGKITVSATGQSLQAPDTAMVSAGVVTQAKTAGEAMAANARQMTSTFNALKEAGIKPKHIQTSQLSLQPQYDYSDRRAPTITGYEARNTVTARSEDLDKVGPMLDALVKAGANNINGVDFSIKDSSEAKSEARRMAIIKARKKAEEMATAAGVRLGKIISMSESNQYGGPQPYMARGMALESAESTPIAGGEQSLNVTVNITYAIEQ